ncbi:MAG: pyruvate formate lyase-activating protein [Candidatus Pacebacteria bacterium]|nr:pyruvate formate lyase-activating protein [Candidatus Paceibacterota bacterium]
MLVHSIETFGTHDGPGIRLVVFTQGCLFACAYCHNPDSQPLKTKQAKEVTTAEILQLLEKEKPYFGKTGGLTVSGGEPTVQATAIKELFQAAQQAGFHTTLDTCGAIYKQDINQLYDLADLVMLDVKHIDETWHQKLTGHSNKNVLKNAAYREQTGKPMWLRYVLVPGWTDQPEYLEQWAKYFSDFKTVERVELLPYHTLGVYKYAELGLPYKLAGVEPATKEQAEQAKAIFDQYLSNVIIR